MTPERAQTFTSVCFYNKAIIGNSYRRHASTIAILSMISPMNDVILFIQDANGVPQRIMGYLIIVDFHHYAVIVHGYPGSVAFIILFSPAEYPFYLFISTIYSTQSIP